MAPAIIHLKQDSVSGRFVPWAVFSAGLKAYSVDARYVFRKWQEGEKLEVIYETGEPAKAAVYRTWGYWIRWEELLTSILLLIALYLAATAITHNPTPEAVIDQLEHTEVKKRKYLE